VAPCQIAQLLRAPLQRRREGVVAPAGGDSAGDVGALVDGNTAVWLQAVLAARCAEKPYGADAADAGGSAGLLRGNGTLPPTDTPTLPPPIGVGVGAQSRAAAMRFIDNS
jgi:hypothetical protein